MDQELHTKDADQYPSAPHRLGVVRRLARLGVVAGVVALIVLGWSLFSAHRAAANLKAVAEQDAAVVVSTIKPKALSGTTDLVLPGSVQANYEAPIYARASGYLKRWFVDIGAPVKAGQLLGEIETPEIDQQLRQAEADLATAEANQKIAQVTAERWRNLRATDSVSKQEADEKISLSKATDAQVQSAKANVQRLRELAGFQKIVAPFDGVVTARNTDIGQLINAGGGTGPELFRVADMRRLRLYVRVPQTYAALMRPGVTAELKFPDRPGKSYTAKLDSTSNAIDTSSRTLLVQLLVDNKNNELLPGAYTEVRFEVPPGTDEGSFKLPANVLLFRGDGTQVATVDGSGHVALKQVTIGRDYGSEIEIVNGLRADDNVILSPPDSLTEGALVRVAAKAAKRVAKL